jgi:nucleoside-diphosphate-sugar epimerase
MAEFYSMAKKGRVYIFGNGELRMNPIHGEDLAVVCLEAIDKRDQEIKVGGPDTLTHNKIAALAFDVLGDKPKITHIPNWLRVVILRIVRLFSGSKIYGPIEFFMTVMAMDMLAPEYGRRTLREYFTNLNRINV